MKASEVRISKVELSESKETIEIWFNNKDDMKPNLSLTVTAEALFDALMEEVKKEEAAKNRTPIAPEDVPQMLFELGWTAGAPEKLERGMALLRNSPNGPETVLVGDVNELGGVCDCCTDYDATDIISWGWLPQCRPLKQEG